MELWMLKGATKRTFSKLEIFFQGQEKFFKIKVKIETYFQNRKKIFKIGETFSKLRNIFQNWKNFIEILNFPLKPRKFFFKRENSFPKRYGSSAKLIFFLQNL